MKTTPASGTIQESKLSIALVAPYAEPEKGACPLRVKSLTQFLQNKGHRVTIFAPNRKNVKAWPNTQRYHSARDLFKRVREGNFDVVWGTSPPMTHSFIAGVAGKLSGAKFVADVRDPWSYVVSHAQEYSQHPLKKWLFSGIDFLSYAIADQVWVVTPGIAEIIRSHSHVSPSKIHLIPNGTIPSLFSFDPAKRTKIRRELGLKNKDVLALYAGGFKGWEVDKLLEEITPALKADNTFLLLSIPLEKNDSNEESSDVQKLRQIVQRNGLEKKVFFKDEKEVPFELFSEYLSAADVGLATVPEALYYCIRVKAYDYASGGLPTIARGPENGSLRQLIEQTQIGEYASSARDVCQLVKTFSHNHVFSRKERKRISQVACEKFDRDISNAKAEKLLLDLQKNSK